MAISLADLPKVIATLTWRVRGVNVSAVISSPVNAQIGKPDGTAFGWMCIVQLQNTGISQLLIGIDAYDRSTLAQKEQEQLDAWMPKASVVETLNVLMGRTKPDVDSLVWVQLCNLAAIHEDPQRSDPYFFRRRCRFDVLRIAAERLSAPSEQVGFSFEELVRSPRMSRLYGKEDVIQAVNYWSVERGFFTDMTRGGARIVINQDEKIAQEGAGYDWEEVRSEEPSLAVESNYDVFVCHASEDKDFVSPLADALKEKDLRVWYDEFELKLGDSLRRSIDKGLASSRYGIVVLSPSFFKKEWTQKELDGLAQKEGEGRKVILPIWHNVSREDVAQYSPMFADRHAVRTSEPLENVVREILEVVRPSGK